MNPDRVGNENGGWYSVLMHSPMYKEIRPEFPEETPLSERMPNIWNEPGTGVNAPSVRDLRIFVDVFDTLDESPLRGLEKSKYTVDRIEVREYDLVAD